MYQHLIEQNRITHNGQIHYVQFNNIVNLGTFFAASSWVSQFINDFHKKIPQAELAEDAVKIGKALLAFRAGQYDEVIYQLNTVGIGNQDHALRVKSLLLRTYFEMDSNGSLFKSECKSYRQYFKNNSLLKAVKREGRLNFLAILRKMAKTKDWQPLRMEIDATDVLSNRMWLLQKVMSTAEWEKEMDIRFGV
ncbi:MAG: hypothetical protein AAF960_01195 [Bacteroidota bacterium]